MAAVSAGAECVRRTKWNTESGRSGTFSPEYAPVSRRLPHLRRNESAQRHLRGAMVCGLEGLSGLKPTPWWIKARSGPTRGGVAKCTPRIKGRTGLPSVWPPACLVGVPRSPRLDPSGRPGGLTGLQRPQTLAQSPIEVELGGLAEIPIFRAIAQEVAERRECSPVLDSVFGWHPSPAPRAARSLRLPGRLTARTSHVGSPPRFGVLLSGSGATGSSSSSHSPASRRYDRISVRNCVAFVH